MGTRGVLTNLRACVVEGDAAIRRDVANLLAFAGITVAEDARQADFAIVGAETAGATAVSSLRDDLPLVALDGRAASGRVTAQRLPYPFRDIDLYGTLQRLGLGVQRGQAAPGEAGRDGAFRELIGQSPAIARVREMMLRVVDTDATVLITGESGTGKEVVARCLHEHSHRRGGPFVPVNCGAIPAELLESELFGHTRGAFTGAISDRVGRFELAQGGTLFLDEIGDLPLHMQVKLLRAIQERAFERVGGTQTIRADVRIVAATHKDLETLMSKGLFRDDLFYRLNVFPIDLPPLRERTEDIPLLIEGYLALATRVGQRGIGSRGAAPGGIRFTSAALSSLRAHEWSGNVRELINLIERLCILFPEGVVDLPDLPRKFQHAEAVLAAGIGAASSAVEAGSVDAPAPVAQAHTAPHAQEPARATWLDPDALPMLPVNGIDLRDFMTRLERNLIQQALDDTNSVVAHAADRLHIRRTTLVEKMRKYGLGRSEASDAL